MNKENPIDMAIEAIYKINRKIAKDEDIVSEDVAFFNNTKVALQTFRETLSKSVLIPRDVIPRQNELNEVIYRVKRRNSLNMSGNNVTDRDYTLVAHIAALVAKALEGENT